MLELVWLLHLSEMSQQFVEDYMFWLLTKKECSHNTSTKWLKNFKKIILLSLAKGWLKKDPFAEYKFTLEAIDRDFLEDSEIQGIFSKKKIKLLGWIRYGIPLFFYCLCDLLQ